MLSNAKNFSMSNHELCPFFIMYFSLTISTMFICLSLVLTAIFILYYVSKLLVKNINEEFFKSILKLQENLEKKTLNQENKEDEQFRSHDDLEGRSLVNWGGEENLNDYDWNENLKNEDESLDDLDGQEFFNGGWNRKSPSLNDDPDETLLDPMHVNITGTYKKDDNEEIKNNGEGNYEDSEDFEKKTKSFEDLCENETFKEENMNLNETIKDNYDAKDCRKENTFENFNFGTNATLCKIGFFYLKNYIIMKKLFFRYVSILYILLVGFFFPYILFLIVAIVCFKCRNVHQDKFIYYKSEWHDDKLNWKKGSYLNITPYDEHFNFLYLVMSPLNLLEKYGYTQKNCIVLSFFIKQNFLFRKNQCIA